MTREEKVEIAKSYIAAKIGDIIERNFDTAGGALEAPGTFSALIESYQAIENL